MFKQELQKYAELIVRQGVNLQKGQGVIIYSSIEASLLVNLIEKECISLGAAKVIKVISDEKEIKEKLNHLDELNESELDPEGIDSFVRIRIRSEGLNYLSDVNQEKLIKYNAYNREKHKNINIRVHQWTIVAFPSKTWAKDVFPSLKEEEAVESLWNLIKKVVRLDGDPIKNWKEHDKNLHDKCDYLNSLNIKSLHYKSSNGTDFNISLKPNVLFIGGSVKDPNGVIYEPNIPSEEVYTAPDVKSANGVVYATKPLFLYGRVYQNFGFRFKDGEVVEVLGDENAKELLSYIFNNVPNSNKLGEVALVPFNSPVNKCETLFYKNLLDENASSHLALGDAIHEAIKDYDSLTKEERDSFELNKSPIHIDFMIGTPDLEVTAELYDGKCVPIFINGNWAN